MLDRFIAAHRDEIITRCRAKVAVRSVAVLNQPDEDYGVPLFLDQLIEALRLGVPSSPEIGESAIRHGRELLRKGFTVSQVVHDYGDVCQSVTELATETNAVISSADFCVLNRCLDDAIAGAVTEYGRQRDQSTVDVAAARGGAPTDWNSSHTSCETCSTPRFCRLRFSEPETWELPAARAAYSIAVSSDCAR